jgi:nucleoside-diphosphate-sugar epimerase
MEQRTILVTGGLGFIGHNVVSRLETQGHRVIVTDIQTNYGLVPQTELDYLIEERRKKITTDRIFRIDIADQSGIDWLVAKHQPDTIVHMASFPRQKVVNANPQSGSRAMSEGLLNLLEAGKKHQVGKFLYISSSMVYGDFANNVAEDAVCCPQGQYGIMKLAGEWLVRDYTRSTGMAHVIIRPSAVYGPLDVEDRVVAKFMTAAIQGNTLQVNGASESLDFTYVDDVAQGIVLAALSDTTNNKTYNLTKSHSRSLLDAANLVVKIAGNGSVKINNRDSSFPSRGSLNIDAARRDFGYFPQVDIEEGFQAYYEWINNSVYWSKKTV